MKFPFFQRASCCREAPLLTRQKNPRAVRKWYLCLWVFFALEQAKLTSTHFEFLSKDAS